MTERGMVRMWHTQLEHGVIVPSICRRGVWAATVTCPPDVTAGISCRRGCCGVLHVPTGALLTSNRHRHGLESDAAIALCRALAAVDDAFGAEWPFNAPGNPRPPQAIVEAFHTWAVHVHLRSVGA